VAAARPVSELAVITGTTHGIGRVTSRELAQAGRTVIMLCRNIAAAQTVRAEIIARIPRATIEVVACDLASLDSVRAAAQLVRQRYGRLGLLINNAGITSMFRRRSRDGFELTFATNHLGPFLLTHLLLERLEPAARIVTVASRVHYRSPSGWDGIERASGPYRPLAAYARSKLANVMHTFALARRLAGSGISVNCLHPGVVATHLLPAWLRVVKPLISPVIFDAERGARTTLYLALAAEPAPLSGCYFDEHGSVQPASALACDVEAQEDLWRASARWAGLPA
jgi:NAD(P)-dependent dehydrogenase (short-subunit alcohol dehydrogenase family)